MERLTKKEQLAGHTVNYVGADNCFDVWSVPKKFMGNAIDRLAAYEDTGLEPEAVEHLKLASMGKAIAEIKEFDGIPIDRLRELAQADKEGRCVVLPKADISNYKSIAGLLSDDLTDWTHDPSVGLYGPNGEEAAIMRCFITALEGMKND